MASDRSSASLHSVGSSMGTQKSMDVVERSGKDVYFLVSSDGKKHSYDDKKLCCPICLDLFEEAHVTVCGHSFCFSCIRRAIDNDSRCPECGIIIKSEHIFPNILVRELVDRYKTKMVDLEMRQALASGASIQSNRLQDFITSESQALSLPEIYTMLNLLTKRKQTLEAETCTAKNELLNDFLEQLRVQKEEKLSEVSNELVIINSDIAFVQSILKNVDVSGSKFKFPHSSSEVMDVDLGNEAKNMKIDLPVNKPVINPVQRSRINTYFDDFATAYLSMRSKELKAEEKRKDLPDSSSTMTGLDEFRESLVKFCRYSSFRSVANLNYCAPHSISSTIVSSIEFDKDNEYFAIGGVIRIIKVYDYNVIIRDTIDIHYPSSEMACTSKISCLSWNARHKGILASSDYEGSVTIWDVGSGQKTKVFQEHEKRCWSVDFNNVDPRLIASGSDDSRVKLWDLNNDHSVASLEAKANVCCVKFNPKSNYHLAFGSADHCVHYYDLRKLKDPLSIYKGHRKAVSYVKFLNKDELVSASTDSQLKMWNVNKPFCVRSFTGHANEKNFVGLATNGEYITCGSENNSLYMYYKGFTKHLFHYKFDSPRSIIEKAKKEDDTNDFVSAVCWRPESNVIVAANSQGNVKLLEME